MVGFSTGTHTQHRWKQGHECSLWTKMLLQELRGAANGRYNGKTACEQAVRYEEMTGVQSLGMITWFLTTVSIFKATLAMRQDESEFKGTVCRDELARKSIGFNIFGTKKRVRVRLRKGFSEHLMKAILQWKGAKVFFFSFSGLVNYKRKGRHSKRVIDVFLHGFSLEMEEIIQPTGR